MGFYYFSLFSWLAFLVYFAIVTLPVMVVWHRLKLAAGWLLLLIPAVFIAPWVEELWIAYNFGQFCRKDAGKFIYKTVDVDGFYDSTILLDQIYSPVAAVTAEDFDKRGYKFYEMSLVDNKGGPMRVAHFEKVSGDWTATVLDKPSARYHYSHDRYGIAVAHKITRGEERVIDSVVGEVIGRYVGYGRAPYWFWISLGVPPYSCDGPDGGPDSKHQSLIYRDILKPRK